MNKITGILGMGSLINFLEQNEMIKYLEANIQDRIIVDSVKKSYKKTLIITTIVTLILLGVFAVVMVSYVPKMDKYSAQNTRPAHVSGNKVWYFENAKHELSLLEYGYGISDYQDGDKFIVILDRNNNVVELMPQTEFDLMQNSMLFNIFGMIPVMIIVLLITIPIGRKTYGKEWYQYGKWYKSFMSGKTKEKFTLL